MAESGPKVPLYLVPSTAEPVTADDQLEAAVLSALGGAVEVPEPEAVSYGRSWAIQPENGGFVVRAGEPVPVAGTQALEAWALMAIYTVRYSSTLFSDEFGVEGLDEAIGVLGTDLIVDSLKTAFERALLQHDRVTAVENLDVSFDALQGIVFVSTFTLVTDDDGIVDFANIILQVNA